MTTKTKTLITSLAVCGGILIGAGTAEADATYTVKSGDTLSDIAERTGQSVSELAQKNGISDINHLSVGQVIETDDTSESGTYTVKSGDTLSGIAEKYGTTVDRLMQLNHLSSDFLVVGEQIATVSSQEPAQTVQTQPQSTTTNSAQSSSQTYAKAQNSQNVQSADQQTSTYYNSSVSESEQAAKEWIAQRESHGSYSARNGQYVGKYQLSVDKLNGDMTPANQERTADNYVKQRYGSWAQAKQAWLQNGWY